MKYGLRDSGEAFMNYKLTLQYDGTDFQGWQIQDGQRTVQGELVRALSLLEGEAVAVHGAGRTDAGVHAVAQVANVKLLRRAGLMPERLRGAINGNSPRDVRVINVETVADDFHARFSAHGKTYSYRIFNAAFMSPFWARYALHEARPLDVEQMQSAAELFIGEHDWTTFSAAQTDVSSRVRRVTELSVETGWSERGRGHLISITISAGGFLRYMVRSIVGALLALGRGEINEEAIKCAIETKDRTLLTAASTAPAYGLTLMQVHYD
jgi:tRNA pseudouridine38-40 synthase